MRNFNAIIVDDHQSSIDHLLDYFQTVKHVQVIGTFTDPLRALTFVRVNPVDLVILDVDLGQQINGLEWISTVTRFNLKIILYTGFRQFEDDGYARDVIDVLLKPVTYIRFMTAIHRLDMDYRLNNPPSTQSDSLGDSYNYFMVKVDNVYGRVKILFKNIIYIEAKSRYVAIHVTTESKLYTSISTFRDLCDLLPQEWFKQCSRSIAFNINFFQSYNKKKIRLNHVKHDIAAGNLKIYEQFRKFLDHNHI